MAARLLFSWVYLDDPASDDVAGRGTFDGTLDVAVTGDRGLFMMDPAS